MPAFPLGDPEPQTLDAILDWHRGVVDALNEQRATVHTAIRTGSHVGPRFIGMTEVDVDDHRYWNKPVEVDQLDPDEVYDRANALLQAIPA